MTSAEEQLEHSLVLKLAESIGYRIPKENIPEYAELLSKTRQNFELVASLDDYQPEPNLDLTPREHVHFPTPSDNPLNAWAWKLHCQHRQPKTRTLEGKTVCAKDN
ncbi:hypothetical protein KC352_g28630, partial [Hortaea werneckii]